MPIDDWLPEYDVRERHERRIDASPERALELALAAPAAPDRIVQSLFRLRGVPRAATIEELAACLGLVERERTPALWVGAGGRRVTIAIDFVARPDGGGAVLSTETRVRAHTRRARMVFRGYWLLVGPFSALIRRRWLRAIAHAARA
jgi:hypothetical protein